MLKVYVAGAMRSDNPLQFLENLRVGMRMSSKVLISGYAVFSPFIDFQFFFMLNDGEKIAPSLIQGSSMEWLRSADAVLVCPGWENSSGTRAELKEARMRLIPVFTSLDELVERIPPDSSRQELGMLTVNYKYPQWIYDL